MNTGFAPDVHSVRWWITKVEQCNWTMVALPWVQPREHMICSPCSFSQLVDNETLNYGGITMSVHLNEHRICPDVHSVRWWVTKIEQCNGTMVALPWVQPREHMICPPCSFSQLVDNQHWTMQLNHTQKTSLPTKWIIISTCIVQVVGNYLQ